jgi:hypothetical protein
MSGDISGTKRFYIKNTKLMSSKNSKHRELYRGINRFKGGIGNNK